MREGMLRRRVVVQVAEQLGELLGEVVRRRLAAVSLQREHRARVRARRTAEAQIDSSGEEPAQRAEALGHLERAVVRQHHPAAAHADARRGRRDDAYQHLGARAGEPRCGVMLRHPVAVVAERLGVAGEIDRVVQGVRPGGSLRDRRLVEDAEPEGSAQASTSTPTPLRSTSVRAAACLGRTGGMRTAARSAPSTANPAPTTNAWWKPLWGAGGSARWPARSDVRATAMVARIASPSEPPICRAVLTRPDASPASCGALPAIAAMVTGTNARPTPSAVMISAGKTSIPKLPPTGARPNSSIPTPTSAMPSARIGPAPMRAVPFPAICAPTATDSAIGRIASPVSIGLKPRTSWR